MADDINVEIHTKLAKQTFNTTWDLMEKQERTAEDEDNLLAAAYASLYHWSIAGTALNRQRGHWLISRVHTVLGNPGHALFHANRCLNFTENNPDLIKDFDVAFAFESVARAHSLNGNSVKAQEYIEQALLSAEDIKKSSDREYFLKDLRRNKWGKIKP